MTQDEFDDLLRLIEEAESSTANEWEEEFVSDMKERAENWGRRLFVSDRQMEILERIANDD